MIDSDFMSEEDFIMYLFNEGVTVFQNTKGNFNFHNFYPSANDIELQLKLLKKFHDVAGGYSGSSYCRLKDENGKQIEEMKVCIKQFARDMRKIDSKLESTPFEKQIKNIAYEYIEKNEKCMNELKECDYNKIIERSMKNREICLGNAYFDNLFYIRNGEEKKIKIFDIKKCSYNCLEIDGVKLIRRLSKKVFISDKNKLIDKYCRTEELEDDSRILMDILIMYPHEIIKLWKRYKYNKKAWSEEEYIDKLNNVILKDKKKFCSEKEVE